MSEVTNLVALQKNSIEAFLIVREKINRLLKKNPGKAMF